MIEMVRTLPPLPSGYRKKIRLTHSFIRLKRQIEISGLNTVCESARCPNISECFEHKNLTLLLLGNVCTRACAFCGIETGKPDPLTPDEPRKTAMLIARIGLRYVVLTSVTRDDLEDGGAGHIAATIEEIRGLDGSVKIEVLAPDFLGSRRSIDKVLKAGPDVFAHNVETVKTLYPVFRKGSEYKRSLKVLSIAHGSGFVTKSGIMLGLGERIDDILELMRDIRDTGCRILTIGQYLRPTSRSPKAREYVARETFDLLRDEGLNMGFGNVISGPFIRSSYMAEEAYGRILSH